MDVLDQDEAPAHHPRAGDPSRQILLERPGPRELVAKGATAGPLFLATGDVHAVRATLEDRGAELTEDPLEPPYGTAFGRRDPFGIASSTRGDTTRRLVLVDGVRGGAASTTAVITSWGPGRPRRR